MFVLCVVRRVVSCRALFCIVLSSRCLAVACHDFGCVVLVVLCCLFFACFVLSCHVFMSYANAEVVLMCCVCVVLCCVLMQTLPCCVLLCLCCVELCHVVYVLCCRSLADLTVT